MSKTKQEIAEAIVGFLTRDKVHFHIDSKGLRKRLQDILPGSLFRELDEYICRMDNYSKNQAFLLGSLLSMVDSNVSEFKDN